MICLLQFGGILCCRYVKVSWPGISHQALSFSASQKVRFIRQTVLLKAKHTFVDFRCRRALLRVASCADYARKIV